MAWYYPYFFVAVMKFITCIGPDDMVTNVQPLAVSHHTMNKAKPVVIKWSY